LATMAPSGFEWAMVPLIPEVDVEGTTQHHPGKSR
jgi:hypothetical protein